jgi:uncharacterized protein YhfF
MDGAVLSSSTTVGRLVERAITSVNWNRGLAPAPETGRTLETFKFTRVRVMNNRVSPIAIGFFMIIALPGCQKQAEVEKVSEAPHSSVVEMWNAFSRQNSDFRNQPVPESFYFCDNKKDADACALLVVDGVKQATSTSLWWFEKNKHPIPKPGDVYVVTDWAGVAKAVIRTTKVERVPFNEVTPRYARIEGEGDKSLEYWKRTHWDYYSREMQPLGETPTEDMVIICEQFETIWK